MANARRLFVCGLLLLIASSAAAATRTWAGATGNWSNPANWVGGVAPAAGDDLVFPSGLYTATNDYPASTPFRSLTFPDGPNGSATLAGNGIVLGAGGIVNQRALTTIGLPITLGADQTWQVTQALELRQPTDINGRTLTIANTSVVTWTDSGHAGSGQVIVNGGRLHLGGSTGTSTLTLNGVSTVFEGGAANSAPHPGLIVVNGGAPPDPRRGLVLYCDTNAPVTINGDTLMPDDLFLGPTCDAVLTRDLAMGPGATYSGYPLRVTGTVALGGATLRFPQPWNGALSPGSTITLIDNDGVDPVSGTFAGLPEGATFRDGTRYFVITYHGGTGNDVVLYQVTRPSTHFVVTNLNDSGPGSLRQALLDANATLGFDTVTFAPGLTGTITLTSGEIPIVEHVNVLGPAGGGITVSGNNASRIFAIDTDTVSIANLAFTAGRSAEGGAIHARIDDLDLTNVTFTNNTALTGGGGALYVNKGESISTLVNLFEATFTGNSAPNGMGGAMLVRGNRVDLDGVVMSGNQAGARGGALHAIVEPPGTGVGVLRVRNATVTNNQSCLQLQTAACGGGGFSFAGQDLIQFWSQFEIDTATFSGNVATPANNGLGGGIFLTGRRQVPLTVARSTVSGNSAAAGGGIYSETTVTHIDNSTIVNNTATGAGGGLHMAGGLIASVTIAANNAGGDGGGVYIGEPNPLFRFGPTQIRNSIIADNQTPAATPDVAILTGDQAIARYSLIRTPGTSTVVLSTGTITGQDPLLGPLQTDPFSPTATRDPLPGSPVIDTGDPAYVSNASSAMPDVDQRYYPRVVGGRIDMGAVEVQVLAPSADLALSAPAPTFTATQPGSYRILVTNPGPTTAANVVVTDGPLTGATLLSATASQGSCTLTTTVTCNLGDVTPGTTVAIDVFLVYAAPGSSSNTATVTSATPDPVPASNSVTRTFTVNPLPPPVPRHDLALTGSVAQQGQQLVYTFVVTNNGPDAAQDVVFTDPIPAGTSFVSANATQGACTNANGTITCTLGTLGDDATATITVTLLIESPGEITNVATVAARANAGLGETAFTNNVAAVVFASHGEAHIPTLGEWMLMLLAGLLGLAACLVLRVR